MTKYMFGFCVALSLILSPANGNSVLQIDQSDMAEIKCLFEALFKYDELSFVLFGDKPLSFCFVDIKRPRFKLPEKLDHSDSVGFELVRMVENILFAEKNYRLEWEKWEKYLPFINNEQYIFSSGFGVLLADKVKLKSCLIRNLDRFQQLLGHDFDPNIFIDQLAKGENLFKLLRSNHELVGLILGYGRHNSSLFQRRHVIFETLYPTKIPLDLHLYLSPSDGFLSIEEELQYMERTLNADASLTSYFPIVDLNCVCFATDASNPESIQLIQTYKNNRKVIRQILSKDDWFERIIDRLSSRNENGSKN